MSVTIDQSLSIDAIHFEESEDDDDYGTPHVSEDNDNHDVCSFPSLLNASESLFAYVFLLRL